MISPQMMLPILAGLQQLEKIAKAGEMTEDDRHRVRNMFDAYTDSSVGWSVGDWLDGIAKKACIEAQEKLKNNAIQEAQ